MMLFFSCTDKNRNEKVNLSCLCEVSSHQHQLLTTNWTPQVTRRCLTGREDFYPAGSLGGAINKKGLKSAPLLTRPVSSKAIKHFRGPCSLSCW